MAGAYAVATGASGFIITFTPFPHPPTIWALVIRAGFVWLCACPLQSLIPRSGLRIVIQPLLRMHI